MAMLPVPYVSRSHCLTFEVHEPSKLFTAVREKCGRRVTYKSKLQKKTLHLQFLNPARAVPYNHHVPKALSTSDVSIVETKKKNVLTYRFMTETGGQLKVLVRKKCNNKYGVRVELEFFQHCEGKGELYMIWGLFKDDSERLMLLDFPNSISNNTAETPFIEDSLGNLALDLEFKNSVAPFYVSLMLKSQLGSTYRNHRKTNFIVPVGFDSGRPFPLGISFMDNGFVNFAFYSRNARSVVLCLYTDTNIDKPSLEIDLDPYVNRSGDIWHALVDCSLPFVSYGYRCKSGVENKGHHVLLDPYARVLEDCVPEKSLGKLIKEPTFDWSGDFRPNVPMEKLIIYRLNVTRFTVDKSSKLLGEMSGTFSGISEKLNHFKSLGVNAILLEPIFPFHKHKGPYYPYHFFSPRSSYGLAKSMKEMVKKLHANGIEVFLEIVFTHRSDSDLLRENDDSGYYDKNGKLNCNFPIVQQMILESLWYWVVEFHIDGFCFVNASSLMIGGHGEFLPRPPLVEAIAFDPLLSRVKIIADSWDPHRKAVGVGEIAFPHWKRWAEMNGNFSFDVRNFLRGQALISSLATRICGSGDRFLSGRGPQFSFNFITRNSGLTLVDLVSFNGSELDVESECSWNCGEQGPTDKTTVLERRLKQIRNFLFILFISLGVPVLNMGDECGQSCGGSLSYDDRWPLDWNALRSGFSVQITQFISFMSSLRMRRGDFFQRMSFMNEANIEWRGTERAPPNWDDESCRFLAMTLEGDVKLGSDAGGDMFVAFNGGDRSEKVFLPKISVGGTWVRLVDTSLPFPGFFSVDGVPIEFGLETYEMESHSCVLFEARRI